MRNVLLIAFEFPPVHTTGSIRPLKFVKYLNEFGYRPIVIAPEIVAGKFAFPHAKMDDSLLNELKDVDMEVHRVPVKDYARFYSNKFLNVLYHYFFIGDLLGKFWMQNVAQKVDEILTDQKVDVLYVCCPPFGIASVGKYIAQKNKLPWILDMRDHWALWGTGAYISRIHYYLNHLKEKRAFKSAALVSSVTTQVIQDFSSAHPELPMTKWKVIPNGFDADGLDFDPIAVDLTKNKKINIGYMGEFYFSPSAHDTMFIPWYKKKWNRMFQYSPRKEDYKYRSPYYFFRALSLYFDQFPDMKERVFFHYIGTVHEWLEEMIGSFNLDKNCVLYGKVNYTKSKELAKTFDVCLSTSSKVMDGEDYCLASKTFDYIGLKKPILGFVTKGSHREFLKRAGIAFLCDPDDQAAAVKKMDQLFKVPTTLNYNKEFLENFDRREGAKKLSAALSEIIDSTN